MKLINFYATAEDILQVLDLVESAGSVQYVPTGNYSAGTFKGVSDFLGSGEEIPNLGKASADSSVGCDAFLVCDRETPVTPRVLLESDRVCIDQLINPDTVVFTPGGLWNDQVLLHGKVGTASDSEASQSLMRRFKSAIKKTFTKVNAFYVGPKAFELQKSGTRLTISVQSPFEFDLNP